MHGDSPPDGDHKNPAAELMADAERLAEEKRKRDVELEIAQMDLRRKE